MDDDEEVIAEQLQVAEQVCLNQIAGLQGEGHKVLQKYYNQASDLNFLETVGFEDMDQKDRIISHNIVNVMSQFKGIRVVVLVHASAISSNRGMEVAQLFNLVKILLEDVNCQIHQVSTFDDLLMSVLPLVTHSQGLSHRKIQFQLEKLGVNVHFHRTKPLLVRMISLLKEHKENMLLWPAGEIGASRLPHVLQLIENLTPIVDLTNPLNPPFDQRTLSDVCAAFRRKANLVR